MKRLTAVAFAVTLFCAVMGLSSSKNKPEGEEVIPGRDARHERFDMSQVDGNQSPGWVFGRLVGATQTPGSTSYSPFGRSTDSLKRAAD